MELYIVALVDDNGNVEGFPKGGGSSSPSFIRAFESKSSAKRSLISCYYLKESKRELLSMFYVRQSYI